MENWPYSRMRFEMLYFDEIIHYTSLHTLNSMYQTHATTMKLLETPSCSLTPFHLLPPKESRSWRIFEWWDSSWKTTPSTGDQLLTVDLNKTYLSLNQLIWLKSHQLMKVNDAYWWRMLDRWTDHMFFFGLRTARFRESNILTTLLGVKCSKL